MNIVIVNQPLNNRGDESAHRALIRKLTSEIPDVHIQVITILNWRGKYTIDDVLPFMESSPKVEYVNMTLLHYGLQRFVSYAIRNKLLSFLCYLHPGFLKLALKYIHADYVLCAPGGICLGGFQNWSHLTMLYVAKLLHKKILYFGRSIGPFPEDTQSRKIFRKGAIEILKYSKFVSLRDSKSVNICHTLGINCVQTVDTAFLDEPHTAIPDEINEIIGSDSYVVMVPNLLIWHGGYKGRVSKDNVLLFFKKIALCLLKKFDGSKIVMLPQTFGNNMDAKLWNDYNFLSEVKMACNDSRVVVISDCYSSDIQQEIIRRARFLTGARYHSIVFAVNNKVPFVSLSYEHKMSGMLDTLGAKDYVLDISGNQLETETELEKAVNLFESKLEEVSFDIKIYNQAKQISEHGFANMLEVIK